MPDPTAQAVLRLNLDLCDASLRALRNVSRTDHRLAHDRQDANESGLSQSILQHVRALSLASDLTRDQVLDPAIKIMIDQFPEQCAEILLCVKKRAFPVDDQGIAIAELIDRYGSGAISLGLKLGGSLVAFELANREELLQVQEAVGGKKRDIFALVNTRLLTRHLSSVLEISQRYREYAPSLFRRLGSKALNLEPDLRPLIEVVLTAPQTYRNIILHDLPKSAFGFDSDAVLTFTTKLIKTGKSSVISPLFRWIEQYNNDDFLQSGTSKSATIKSLTPKQKVALIRTDPELIEKLIDIYLRNEEPEGLTEALTALDHLPVPKVSRLLHWISAQDQSNVANLLRSIHPSLALYNPALVQRIFMQEGLFAASVLTELDSKHPLRSVRGRNALIECAPQALCYLSPEFVRLHRRELETLASEYGRALEGMASQCKDSILSWELKHRKFAQKIIDLTQDQAADFFEWIPKVYWHTVGLSLARKWGSAAPNIFRAGLAQAALYPDQKLRTTLALNKEIFGIHNLGTFVYHDNGEVNWDLLEENERNLDPLYRPDAPTWSVLCSKDDYNRALEIGRSFQGLTQRCKLFVSEVGSTDEAMRISQHIASLSGGVDLNGDPISGLQTLVLISHSFWAGMRLGGNPHDLRINFGQNDVTGKDWISIYDLSTMRRLGKMVRAGGAICLDGCWTGRGGMGMENLLTAWSKAAPHAWIIASRQVSSWRRYTAKEDGSFQDATIGENKLGFNRDSLIRVPPRM